MTPFLPAATKRWPAARTQRMVPVRVMSRTMDHCSSVISSTLAVPPRPALLIMMSTPPNSSAASSSACDLGLVGHVADELAHPVGAELLGQGRLVLGQPALVGVAEDDRLGALLQRPAYDGGADAGAGGRGDHHDLAGEQVVARHVVRDGLLGTVRGSLGPLGFSGQAEHALGQDVALHLVAAAIDACRSGRRGTVAATRSGRSGARLGDQAGGAEHVHGDLAEPLVPVGPGQLEDRGRSAAGRGVLAAGRRWRGCAAR